ncbi:MAG: hypothetical protein JRH20_11810 [Deltaproteobacteria bacterium]|nr:hypothetical protein [Deltaproteobacteria bacterium]
MIWEDLVTAFEQHFTAERCNDDQLAITLTYASGRTQLLVLDHFASLGQQWVSLRTRVCARSHLPPAEALARNHQLVVGDLCLDDDFYVLQSKLLLRSVTLPDIELHLQVLGRTADEMEAALETGNDHF